MSDQPAATVAPAPCRNVDRPRRRCFQHQAGQAPAGQACVVRSPSLTGVTVVAEIACEQFDVVLEVGAAPPTQRGAEHAGVDNKSHDRSAEANASSSS
ncbi:MAG: hypothetical protein WCA57_15635, partial [Ilumatobacteraceae bacterium]